jgi:hypothetical protein
MEIHALANYRLSMNNSRGGSLLQQVDGPKKVVGVT